MNKKKPTIEAFRAFAAFAETGGVRAASRKLETTQPVVTKKLSVFKKEDNAGVILIRQNGKRLNLTESGQEILPAVQEMIRQYDCLIDYLSGRIEATHRIRIATGFFGAEYFLPRILDRELSLEVQIDIQILRGRERILGVVDGHYDFGVLSHERNDIVQLLLDEHKSPDAIQVEHLNNQKMVVIAAKKTPEGQELESLPVNDPVPISLLNTWELLGLDRNSGIRRKLERQFPQGENVCFVTEGGGWSAARELARRGVGVSVQPLATLRNSDRKDFIIRSLSEEFSVEKLVIYRTHELTAELKNILDQLKMVAQMHEKEISKTWERWSRRKR